MSDAAPARKPTADDLTGIAWWNSMTEPERAYWLQRAKADAPKQAWEHYKRATCTDIQ